MYRTYWMVIWMALWPHICGPQSEKRRETDIAIYIMLQKDAQILHKLIYKLTFLMHHLGHCHIFVLVLLYALRILDHFRQLRYGLLLNTDDVEVS